jgi:hypothetical protein
MNGHNISALLVVDRVRKMLGLVRGDGMSMLIRICIRGTHASILMSIPLLPKHLLAFCDLSLPQSKRFYIKELAFLSFTIVKSIAEEIAKSAFEIGVKRVPRWRNGYAIACRAIPIRFDSGPWLWCNGFWPQIAWLKAADLDMPQPLASAFNARLDTAFTFQRSLRWI